LDKRDALTKEYFDEKSVLVIDKTGGSFLQWFEHDTERIVRLSGALRQSILIIEWIDGGYKLTSTGPNIEGDMVRLVVQHAGQALPSLYLYNNAFTLPPGLRRKKLGIRSIATQLFEACETGEFAFVEVDAIGDASTLNPQDPEHQYSGYVVWALIGFDGPLPQGLTAKHPDLAAYARVSEVLAAPDGQRLWLEKGESCRLQFDLTRGSNSWVALHRYMRDNGIEVRR
jgi:hypothetical protein